MVTVLRFERTEKQQRDRNRKREREENRNRRRGGRRAKGARDSERSIFDEYLNALKPPDWSFPFLLRQKLTTNTREKRKVNERERERERFFLHLNSQQPVCSASCFYQCTSGPHDPIGSEETHLAALANQNILVQTDEHKRSLSDDSDQNNNGSKDSRNRTHIWWTCEPCWSILTEWLIKSNEMDEILKWMALENVFESGFAFIVSKYQKAFETQNHLPEIWLSLILIWFSLIPIHLGILELSLSLNGILLKCLSVAI